jgi:hypothetical protein
VSPLLLFLVFNLKLKNKFSIILLHSIFRLIALSVSPKIFTPPFNLFSSASVNTFSNAAL